MIYFETRIRFRPHFKTGFGSDQTAWSPVGSGFATLVEFHLYALKRGKSAQKGLLALPSQVQSPQSPAYLNVTQKYKIFLFLQVKISIYQNESPGPSALIVEKISMPLIAIPLVTTRLQAL